MTSSAINMKECGVCLENIGAGEGQAIFTAECSHTFHFGCICSRHINLCPVCNATWKDPAFSRSSPYLTRNPRPPLRHWARAPIFEPEPVSFSDDDPLPAIETNPTSSSSHKVSIRATPESQVVAASEALSEFSVLVGLKAPSLSEHTFQRAAVDLVTVLDTSGSMSGSKLSLLKRAVHFVIDNLGPSDRLSIVSFATSAHRISPLRRMTQDGRQDAKKAVDSLHASGCTNIVAALEKGAKVLEERHQQNPVATIIFLSDGRDTCFRGDFSAAASVSPSAQPPYLHLLPFSIYPKNKVVENAGKQKTFPVHTFGFGSDHDPLTMHAIADASGGTFSFIESYEMVQDAFASCIGGLLTVLIQDLGLTMRAASHGVEIKSISFGRHASEISEQGSQGILHVGDLYADEEKQFLINLSVPSLLDDATKSTLLDITCSYTDAVLKETVQIECDLVEIQRPKSVSAEDMVMNLEVDRERNRLAALLTITQAQQMAEAGNFAGAQTHLSRGRSNLLSSPCAHAGDDLCVSLGEEMKETERRMQNQQVYARQGRAYALAGMSSHAFQRASTRGTTTMAGSAAPNAAVFGRYATPNMMNMVLKSRLESDTADATPEQEESGPYSRTILRDK